MTELVVNGESAPTQVEDDATVLADRLSGRRVVLEAAYESSWIIRIEGHTDDESESAFRSKADTADSLIEGDYSAFKTYYGYGTSGNKTLIRVEY
jgi:hypothetical protein